MIGERITPIEDVIDVLEKWHPEYLLAIASSGARDMVELVLEKMKVKKYFKIVVTGDDVERVKPYPDIYLKAWELCGFPKDEYLTIEDSESGLLAAKAAGMRCVIVPCDFTRLQDFSQADMTIDKLSKLDLSRF